MQSFKKWPNPALHNRFANSSLLARINWSLVFLIATIVLVCGLVLLMSGLATLSSHRHLPLLISGSLLSLVGFCGLMAACCFHDEFEVSDTLRRLQSTSFHRAGHHRQSDRNKRDTQPSTFSLDRLDHEQPQSVTPRPAAIGAVDDEHVLPLSSRHDCRRSLKRHIRRRRRSVSQRKHEFDRITQFHRAAGYEHYAVSGDLVPRGRA